MSDTPDTADPQFLAAVRVATLVAAFHARLVSQGTPAPIAAALAGEYLRWLLNRPTPTADVVKRSDA